MRKGNGGIIGPQNRSTITVAAGIWSMDEQQQGLGARDWPGTPSASKPNPPSFSVSAAFTATISGRTMNVSAVASGTLAVGQIVTGPGVTQNTFIEALAGGSGGTGNYTLNISQTVASATSMTTTIKLASTTSITVPYTLGYDGGSNITSVTTSVYAGSSKINSVTNLTNPVTIAGLPSNTICSVNIYATNAIGNSVVSTGPYFQTPSVPPAPTIGTASNIAGTTNANVAFTAPSSDGGNAITSYVAVSTPGNVSATNAASPIIVSGLAGNTSYTFTVAATNAVGTGPASAASNSITTPNIVGAQILAVAGGGGSGGTQGSNAAAGGGGGGGVIANTFSLTPGVTYSITVGGGGNGAVNITGTGGVYAGGNGSNSIITGSGFTTQTAVGGGGGGAGASTLGSPYIDGQSGGSGGGAGQGGSNGSGTSGQGYAGGTPAVGGGGGAGGAGSGGSSADNYKTPANGGAALASTITGSTVYYAGGGGAGANYQASGTTNGGLGGGTSTTANKGGAGDGGSYTAGSNGIAGTSGAANTGGGGGGTAYAAAYHSPSITTSANGGSGVVIISAPVAATVVTGSPTVTTSGSNTIYTFTGNGNIKY